MYIGLDCFQVKKCLGIVGCFQVKKCLGINICMHPVTILLIVQHHIISCFICKFYCKVWHSYDSFLTHFYKPCMSKTEIWVKLIKNYLKICFTHLQLKTVIWVINLSVKLITKTLATFIQTSVTVIKINFIILCRSLDYFTILKNNHNLT